MRDREHNQLVLVIEDDKSHADLIRIAFEEQGLWPSLVFVQSLEEARAAIEESVPDLAIADLRLPDGSGIDLLVEDREQPFPLIVMTSFGDENAAVEAMKKGALDYIVKSTEAFASMPHIAERSLREWRTICQRKEAEQKLRALTSKLSQAREQERRQIATELHDRVTQNLNTMTRKLAKSYKMVKDAEPRKILDELNGLLNETIEDVQTLTHEIGSPVLMHLGLVAAIQWLAEKYENKHYLPIAVKDDQTRRVLSDEVRIVLFQAVRELLNNCVKHAKANNVLISIKREDQQLKVVVEDDGVGCDLSNIDFSLQKSDCFGLFNIQEHLKYIGGNFSLESEVGQGAKVILTAPINE